MRVGSCYNENKDYHDKTLGVYVLLLLVVGAWSDGANETNEQAYVNCFYNTSQCFLASARSAGGSTSSVFRYLVCLLRLCVNSF